MRWPDEALAGLLAAWAADPGQSRLLVTCRYRFTLPGGAEQALSFRQLGALSQAETMKLAWSLPALDQLDEDQLEQVWRLAGGHPRSLEYLDALLAGGTARYPDVTARLNDGDHPPPGRRRTRPVAGRPHRPGRRPGRDRRAGRRRRAARGPAHPPGPGPRRHRTCCSGSRCTGNQSTPTRSCSRPASPTPDAGHTPDREAASEQITGILAAAGITVDESFDLAAVPGPVREQLAPHLAELNRPPAPPFRPAPGLPEQAAACQAASLLTATGEEGQQRVFVHRWTATALAARAAREPGQQLAGAHRQAAAY